MTDQNSADYVGMGFLVISVAFLVVVSVGSWGVVLAPPVGTAPDVVSLIAILTGTIASLAAFAVVCFVVGVVYIDVFLPWWRSRAPVVWRRIRGWVDR